MADKPIFELGFQPEGDDPDVGLAQGSETTRQRDLQHVRRRRTGAAKDKRTGLLLAVGLIVVAALALVAVPLLTGDDQPASDGPAEPVLDRVDDDGGGVAETNAPVLAFEPPSTEHLRADEVAWLFESDIDRNDNRYGIAYVAGDDFVVLDDRGITVPELEIAADFDTVASLALLTTNGRTWAIDPVDRSRNYLVSNSYVVVVSERPGTIAIIRPSDRSTISLMSSALPIPSVQLPEGADLLWVQGRGPLVMPRTGGTFEVAGVASSLTKISDDRAVAASLHGTVYESCDDSLACTYFGQVDEGPLTPLPFESGTTFTVSPDAKWIVAVTDDAGVLFEVEAQQSVLTFESGLTAIDWAPDSSFVAIVTGDVLSILYPDDASVVPVRLNHTPDNNSLLVFQDS